MANMGVEDHTGIRLSDYETAQIGQNSSRVVDRRPKDIRRAMQPGGLGCVIFREAYKIFCFPH